MKKINIRLNSTDGSRLYPSDYILKVNKNITADGIEKFIEVFKQENEDYFLEDIADAIAEHFRGKIKLVSFNPEVETTV